LEFLILKLAKEGKSPSQIGMMLRDTYGIPSTRVITKKRITNILKEKKILPEIPEDLMALIKKSVLITKHLKENSKDETAKRGLVLTESKIGRLVKYYKKTGRLNSDWKFETKKGELFVE